jgi:Ca2+-binding EF-hand superfamily protein
MISSEITRCFIELDADGDGELCKEEIHEAYVKSLKNDLSIEQINHIFDECDIELTGKIAFNEFIAATLERN